MLDRIQRQHRLDETRRSVLLLNLLALAVGAGVVAISVITTSPSKTGIDTALEIGGAALVSAAIVSFVFGSFTIRETTLQVDHAVSQAVEEVLEPIREEIYAGAIRGYRWDCHVDSAPAGDSLPDYAYQSIRVARSEPQLPTELRAICVASRQDAVLAPYVENPRYFFRWLVDEELDPADPAIFTVGTLEIDGQALSPPKLVKTDLSSGGTAAEYRWRVPAVLRGSGDRHLVFSVAVRKFLGSQTRIDVRTQIFRTVTDAEFRFTVGPSLGATKVHIGTSEVTRLGPHQGTSCGVMYPQPHELAATAQFRHPLQAGSAVSFSVDRSPDKGLGVSP